MRQGFEMVGSIEQTLLGRRPGIVNTQMAENQARERKEEKDV